MSLLARLLALVLLTAIPPLGLQVWREADANREHRARIAATARDLTLRATVEQERIIDGARQLLGAIVSLRSVRMRDAGPCSVSLRQIAAEFPAYAVLSAASVPGGEVFCSSGRPGTVVADRYWYQAALEQRAFVVGEQVTSRETARRVLHFSRPAMNLAGEVVAIVDAALDLDQLEATLQQAPLAAGAALLVADRKGAVLASLPDRSLVGGPMPQGLARLLARGTAGAEEVTWAGARRVTGYEPADLAPAVGLFVAVGLTATWRWRRRGAGPAWRCSAPGWRRLPRSAWRSGSRCASSAGRWPGWWPPRRVGRRVTSRPGPAWPTGPSSVGWRQPSMPWPRRGRRARLSCAAASPAARRRRHASAPCSMPRPSRLCWSTRRP